MAERYKTVREVIEMLDEKGIILAGEACGDATDPSLIMYATIEAFINEIDPDYFDEEDDYEIPIIYIEEDMIPIVYIEEDGPHPPEAFRDKANGE